MIGLKGVYRKIFDLNFINIGVRENFLKKKVF